MKMSNIIIISLLSLGLVTSFSFIYSVKKEFRIIEFTDVVGSENLTTKNVEVGEFHSIEANDQIKVIISQGPPSVSISAEDNLIDLISVENKDGVLMIGKKGQMNVTVTQNLPMIVEVSNLSFQKLKSNNQSEIMIKGTLNQPEITLSLSNQSNIKGKFETSEMRVTTSQQSNLTLLGNSKRLLINMGDQSGLISSNLEADEVEVNMSNQSTAKIHAINSIIGSIRDNSVLTLKGNPEINQVERSRNAMLHNSWN